MKLRLLMASLMMAMGTCANATDETFHGRWYLGLSGGVSQLQPNPNGSGLTLTEDRSNGAKLVLGRDLTHRFSVELYAADLGEAELGVDDTISYEVYGAHLVAHLYNTGSNLGRYFRDGLSIYAKAGAGGMQNEATVPFEQLNAAHLTYGLGVSGLMGAGFSWRLEAEAYDEDAVMVMLGLVKRFGDVPDPSPPSVDYFDSQRGTAREPDTDVADTVEAGTDDVTPSDGGATVVAIDDSVTVNGVTGSADVDDEAAVVAADPVESLSTTEVETPELPQDSDGDGVLNADDRCNGTAEGLAVDERGCSFTGIVEGLFFASSSSALSRTAMDILDNVIIELIRYPAVLLEVQAHTDNRGPARGNLTLSQQRAQAVVQYMVQGGVSASRLRAVGYGESRPAFQNATEEGRQRNRRVEFRTVDPQGGS